MILRNSLHISHDLIKRAVKVDDIVIDATAGNGHDTLFLSGLVGMKGKVFSFDIQEEALKNTRNRLNEANCVDNVELILDGHSNMDKYITEGVSAIMFNLGYLPGGDHTKGTKAETTIEAIKKGLEIIKIEGIITIVVYYGGDSGFEEKNSVMKYIKTIDSKKYAVLVYEFVNQINCPPIAICIERLK